MVFLISGLFLRRTKMRKLVLFTAVSFLLILVGGVFAGKQKCEIIAELDKPVLFLDESQTVYLKLGIKGYEAYSDMRAPVNVCIVLDKSGSMNGEKIRQAREAAVMAVERLSSNDVVSLVVYDSEVRVVMGATKVSDREMIISRIRQIEAGGNTALYGGVCKGADEVRKFNGAGRVSRIILLSDGLANVGPSSAEELGSLGRELVTEGISVSTVGLGLGYNEDLMSKLAMASDGNHYFAENARDLCRIFSQELNKSLDVVAQQIELSVSFANGVRAVRFLGREGVIDDRQAKLFINQAYSGSEKYGLVEVEVSREAALSSRPFASVTAKYSNVKTRDRVVLKEDVMMGLAKSESETVKHINEKVRIAVIEQIAIEKNELAMQLRDAGKVNKAKEVLDENASYLIENSSRYGSEELKSYGIENKQQADSLEGYEWKRTRKVMRESQSSRKSQR